MENRRATSALRLPKAGIVKGQISLTFQSMTAESTRTWLLQNGASIELAQIGGYVIAGLYLFILALLANLLAKRFIKYVIHPLIQKTTVQWDDLLIKHGVIVRRSHIVPVAMIDLSRQHFLGQA